jgi:hypothetical protein
MYFFIFFFATLILYVLYNHVLTCVLSNSIDIITTRPQRTSPQYQLYFSMFSLYFFRCNRFYYLYNPIRSKTWNTLYQKMYMVLIVPYFYKKYFMASFYLHTNISQRAFYRFGKNSPAIFCRTNQVIQQQTFVVAFQNMFAHFSKVPNFAHTHPDSRVGELTKIKGIPRECIEASVKR